MAGINVSSLSSSLTGSSFDWQSFVDQIISIDSAPITALQKEQSGNGDKLSALNALDTDLNDLQTAAKALSAPGLFTGRTASSSTLNSTWQVNTTTGATPGSYAFDVTRLATLSKRNGATHIAQGISPGDDVSGLTLASLPTSTAVKAGTFTVNGSQVTIALTDSLNDVFTKISAATGGAVTAAYNHTTDKISLTSGSEIILGAANDTSNFLAVARLNNNGTGTVASGIALGTANISTPLASARLGRPITAVDGSGNGLFNVNGVAISYNVNTDSLTEVMKRINSSSAGVLASYDSNNDRMVFTNKTTGDLGIGVSEGAGGLLDALGINTASVGAATVRGNNAQFSINGGPTITSTSNTFDSATTGIAGLSLTASTQEQQTITVASNTTAMKSAIQGFVDKYNVVQSYIDNQTDITVKNGTVSTSLLSSNREVQDWQRTLRNKAFAALSGMTGTVKQIADLGIDFQGTSSQLVVRDSGKMDAALRDHPDDVQAFFTSASTGFVDTMNTFLNSILGKDGTGTDGALASGKNALTSSNASIDSQIAAIQRQLDSEKSRLTLGFQAMQQAQQNAKTMLDSLNNTFGNKSG